MGLYFFEGALQYEKERAPIQHLLDDPAMEPADTLRLPRMDFFFPSTQAIGRMGALITDSPDSFDILLCKQEIANKSSKHEANCTISCLVVGILTFDTSHKTYIPANDFMKKNVVLAPKKEMDWHVFCFFFFFFFFSLSRIMPIIWKASMPLR